MAVFVSYTHLLESTSQFTIVMLVAIIAAFVLKNIFLYFQNVVQLRFVYTNQFSTSRRMMINFMERPYEYYLNADTSVIQRSITSDVNNTVSYTHLDVYKRQLYGRYPIRIN